MAESLFSNPSLLTPPPVAMDDDEPDGYRSMSDIPATRKAIFDNALGAARKLPPLTNTRHTLRLSGVDYSDPDYYDLQAQKKAIIGGKSLGRRLTGNWELLDNATGKVLDAKKMTVARVPFMTDRGTFVHNGVEYTISNQLRMRPGIFSRVKENGEIEAHANILPGEGVGHRYFLDPEKGTFHLRFQQSKLPLLPALRALGATDKELREAWGDALYQANAPLDDANGVSKLFERLVGAKAKLAATDKRQAVAEALRGMKVDPDVMRRTLGGPFATLDKDALLATTKKLLAISKGEQDIDDRDNLAFQTLHGPEDLFAERLEKDYGKFRRNALFKASFKGNLSGLHPGALTRQLESVLLNSGLAQPLEEVNPAEILDRFTRVTKMGEGGLNSLESVPDESRSVQPGHFFFIDPTRTPESERVGIDLYLSSAVRKGRNGKILAPMTELKTGQQKYLSAQEMEEATVTTADQLFKPTKRILGLRGGKMDYYPKDEITHVNENFNDAFSPLAHFVPRSPSMKAQRMSMGSRMSVAGETVVMIRRHSGETYYGPIENYTWQRGDLACSVDKDTCQVVWKPVRARIKHRNRLAMHEVLLASGRTVIATRDHSFVTLDDDGALVKVHTQDLTDGMPVPRAGSVDVAPVAMTWKVPAGNKHNAHPAREFEPDFDLGWFHGVYLSEGSVVCNGKRARCVQLANIETDVLRKLQRFFRGVGIPATACSGREDGRFDRVMVNWCQLGEKLRSEFGNGSYAKKLPSWVFTAPESYRRGLIAGYLAGDGTISRHRADVKVGGGSRSWRLRDGLCDLLLTLGIDTTLCCDLVDSVANGRNDQSSGILVPHYKFHVRAEHVGKLPKLCHAAKDRLLRKRRWSGKRSADWIPIYESARAQIVALTRRQSDDRTRISRQQHTRISVRRVIGDGTTRLHAWLDSAVVWDYVVGVRQLSKSDYEYVYDLDLADNVFMCSGGVFVHNTTQALGLVKGEAPFVRALDPKTGEAYEETYGEHLGAVRAKQGGRVLDVSPDGLTLKYADGSKAVVPLYNNFVLNRKSGLHNTPLVQAGDIFKPGQMLAKSNFTDDKGAAALGLNVRVGYLADKGHNFEDAIRISESLAKRMTSEHMYQHAIEYDDTTRTGRKAFLGLFPSAFERKQLANIDDDGVVKPGTQVNYGDPLILGARQRDTPYGKVHRKGKPLFGDVSEKWEHSNPGIVTDVFKDQTGVNVVVKSTAEMKVGDKLAFRYGDKSVVSGIVPDDQMPLAADGKPLEVLCNPLSIISRGNPAQMAELALGKIAAKTGKQYDLEDFRTDEDLVEFALDELKKHDMTDLEDVTDAETGRKIPKVAVGNRYVMKLSHMAEDKLQGRAFGGYSVDETPAKGGPEGSKQIGLLLTNALLSHGANNTVWDASVVRGQSNPDYWLQVMSGLGAPKPRVPKVYRKFVEQLRGAGINVVEDGTKTHIMAMTNDDVKKMTGGRFIANGDTLDFAKGLKPVQGGLFDMSLTGGPEGDRWAAIKLHQPLPNPVMEEPIRRMLNLTKDKFLGVLSGREKLPNGGTGPEGLFKALDGINIEKALEVAHADLNSGRKGRRDDAVRKLKYLKAAQKLDIHPREWMLDAVPVLPPKYRPVSIMSGKNATPLVADANYLYKELLEANQNLTEADATVDDVADERLALYESFRAVTGLGEPAHPKLREKKVKGLLAHIFGGSPKTGSVQRRLIGSAVDLVGRAVITPDPDLDMDSVGLPEERAWNIYKPFVVRRLRRRGMRLADALRAAEDRTDLARKELIGEMETRPVIIDRAPAWHKFSVMAFWPKLVKHDTLRISPLVVKGFAADFDGDAMQYHVPADDDAVREAATRLLPSANLLAASDFKTPMHQPGQEYTGGLYSASTRRSKLRKRSFADLKSAIAAFHNGKLGIDDEIEILRGG